LFNYLGLTEIRYSTITANDATSEGDGVWSFGYQFMQVRTEVASSIIAGNVGDEDVFTNNASNGFFSGGYNLIGAGNNATDAFVLTGDQTGVTNPMLAALADNGGPTETHALLPGSPAIDAGDPSAMAGVGDTPEFDQRGSGFDRVVGDGIDIGAYERIPPAPQVVDVILGGSGWDPGFVDAVDGSGIGAGNGLGYSLVGAHQLDTVPWTGVDVLYVRFSGDVSASVAAGDIALTGTNVGTYSLGTLQYGVAGPNVLTIPVTGGINVDSLVLSIFDGAVEDGDGDLLDGEWSSGQTDPSGDGVAGGRFDFFFNVLPGDADQSGQVDAGDVTPIGQNFLQTASGPFFIFADLDASGQIDAGDVTPIGQNFLQTLPSAGPPTPPPPPPTDTADEFTRMIAVDELFTEYSHDTPSDWHEDLGRGRRPVSRLGPLFSYKHRR
jgi:hypothetical protein